MVGNKGSDVLKGKGGIDFLRAKDGYRDRKISCGSGPNKRESAKRDRHLDPPPVPAEAVASCALAKMPACTGSTTGSGSSSY